MRHLPHGQTELTHHLHSQADGHTVLTRTTDYQEERGIEAGYDGQGNIKCISVGLDCACTVCACLCVYVLLSVSNQEQWSGECKIRAYRVNISGLAKDLVKGLASTD